MEKTRIDLKLLLPEVPDVRDACIERLNRGVAGIPGIQKVHVVDTDSGVEGAKLCLHYDPSVVSLAEVQRQAKNVGATVTEKFGHLVTSLRAIGSEDLASRIEQDLIRLDGVLSASVTLPGQMARIEFDRSETDAERIKAFLSQSGYRAKQANAATHKHAGHSHDGEKHDHSEGDSHKHAKVGCCDRGDHEHSEDAGFFERYKELVWSLTAGIFLAVGYVGERFFHLPHGIAITIYLVSYAFGGYDLLSHTFRDIAKGRFRFNIDLLMLLAAGGAAALGQFSEGAFLLFLFSLAHALEHYALGRARNAIKALSDLTPPMATVMRDGKTVDVRVEEVKTSEIVVVRPGQRIPVDGKVQRGQSAVNQAPVTGESVPVEKQPGADVFAGTVNGEGALEVETTRAVGDRTLDRVVKLVAEAQTQKAPTQEFTDRFERIFVPLVLIADVLLIAVPPLVGLWPWQVSFYRGMALLVAASPCALALGTPASVLAAIAQAARNGVLIKGGAHLENLGTVSAIAFDKTGTLTIGKPEVTDVVQAEGVAERELLRVSAAVEHRSQHPLAQAVVRRAEKDGIDLPEAGEVQSVTARGVRSTVEGKAVVIGSLRFWEGSAVPEHIKSAVSKLQDSGRSIVVVRHGEQFLGVLGVADEPRANVPQILDRLRSYGLKSLVMLTGDNRGVGEAVAKSVGVDDVKAELLPEDKVTAINELLAKHGRVAMVGDGVNDAPALANATVGIAMGGSGTAVALETADVALMGDDLAKLPFAVKLSRQARAVIKQNLFVSLGVIAFLVVTTTTGMFNIGLAVVFHEGSTLLVIANALRLLTVKESLDADLPNRRPHEAGLLTPIT